MPAVTGELTASGAAESLQASVSTKIESEFYNARLLAWEPLLELWAARVELEVGLGGDARGRSRREPSSSGLLPERGGRFSGDTRRSSAGRQRRGLGRRLSNHRASGDQREPPTGARAAGGRIGKGDGPEGAEVVVGLRFVSDEVLNVNLTESLVENLAAIAHAQQRHEESQRFQRGWAGDGGDNSFSLHWLRNETGLPIGCSARYREPRGAGSRGATDGNGDSEAALPVRVPAGEEAPVVASLGLPVRAVVLEFEEKEGEGERGGGSMASSAIAAATTATLATTRWRSLRPIDLDVVGRQRLTTMVAAAATPSLSSHDDGRLSAAAAEHLQSSVSDRGTSWRSGSWTWAARGAAAAAAAESTAAAAARRRGAETVKVVTEVESHRGVKVKY